MKICVFKESLCLGGTERSSANISKILCRNNDVIFALFDGSNIQYNYGGKLVDFGLPAQNSILAKVFNNIKRIYKYKKLIKKEKIEVLFEFISINSPLSILKHKDKIRIISSRDFSVLEACTKRFHKCLCAADALVCNSNYLREYYTAKYPEHKDKVFTVYNMIDVEEICTQGTDNPDEQFLDFIASHKDTVVSVGRFCKEKGFEYLIKAFSLARNNIQNLGLVLVGDGEYKEKYNELINKYNLNDHVYFTGFQSNPYRYMARCKCFVLSSLTEGFPNVLAEAMALGLPVIATNCLSGPAEILRKDGDYNAVDSTFTQCDFGVISPRIVDNNSEDAVEQLGKAITTVLSDENMMKNYSLLSKQRANEFSYESTENKLVSIFNILYERKKKNDLYKVGSNVLS